MAQKITKINVNGFFISASEFERLLDAADEHVEISKCFHYLGFGYDEHTVTILTSGNIFLKPTYISLDRKNWERLEQILDRDMKKDHTDEEIDEWIENHFEEWMFDGKQGGALEMLTRYEA